MRKADDRIKLAEAMGLDPEVAHDTFDPFTDANDDYAVLEWMRQGEYAKQIHFRSELLNANDGMTSGYPYNERMTFLLKVWPDAYVLGDYARAALKVLE